MNQKEKKLFDHISGMIMVFFNLKRGLQFEHIFVFCSRILSFMWSILIHMRINLEAI